jgi:hypothetical protein
LQQPTSRKDSLFFHLQLSGHSTAAPRPAS